MKNLLFSFTISILCLTSCIDGNHKTNTSNQNESGTEVKTTILLNSERNNWYLKNYGYQKWEPKINDIKIVQEVIDNAIVNSEFDFLKKPVKEYIKEYYLQYIPYINENGERIIEVNAFCEIWDFPPPPESKSDEWIKMDWKNEYVMVFDGGDCYWRLTINIDKKEYYDLMINGVAIKTLHNKTYKQYGLRA